MSAVDVSLKKMIGMLEVIREQFSQPEVFCLAVNIMDRFLCHCQIHKSQLQLVASVCILIASKIREPCPIPGKTLVIYTDCSITADELKVRFGSCLVDFVKWCMKNLAKSTWSR